MDFKYCKEHHQSYSEECKYCKQKDDFMNTMDGSKIEIGGFRVEEVPRTSKNNGGETDYYAIDKAWSTFQDVIEARQMNYAQGNILKVACTFNIGRHDGTNYERDLNKIIYFANRELDRIKR